MAVMKEQYEIQGQALQNMARVNAEIEAEKAEYLAIFSRHNLDMLALKKPGLIENRMNNASEAVMEGLEDDTKELYNIDNPDTSDKTGSKNLGSQSGFIERNTISLSLNLISIKVLF